MKREPFSLFEQRTVAETDCDLHQAASPFCVFPREKQPPHVLTCGSFPGFYSSILFYTFVPCLGSSSLVHSLSSSPSLLRLRGVPLLARCAPQQGQATVSRTIAEHICASCVPAVFCCSRGPASALPIVVHLSALVLIVLLFHTRSRPRERERGPSSPPIHAGRCLCTSRSCAFCRCEAGAAVIFLPLSARACICECGIISPLGNVFKPLYSAVFGSAPGTPAGYWPAAVTL